MPEPSTIESVLRQIQYVTNDLLNTDYASFERHIGKFARLLHTPPLAAISDDLTKNVDFDAWLKTSEATVGAWVGSGRLAFPSDRNQELGIKLRLVDKCATEPEWVASSFTINFSYVGHDIASNLRNFTQQVLVQFVRDYSEYVRAATTGSTQNERPSNLSAINNKKVFVVHGHDEGVREAVARFLERIGLEPIILHERPNKGRTIIEKFHEEAEDIGFAVILMTPDDHGSKVGGSDTKPRARQNVVFELGFFIGVLGRERVAALVKGEIERPTDFDGVVYIDLDNAGGWKMSLGRELQAAGVEIDISKIAG